MRLLTAISIALIILVALACTATPTPTPDVPLLDEETVTELVLGYAYDNYYGSPRLNDCLDKSFSGGSTQSAKAQYLGKDIWVVRPISSGSLNRCTFTVHDKEARVIVSQQDKTTD